jgi:hypothetical protein
MNTPNIDNLFLDADNEVAVHKATHYWQYHSHPNIIMHICNTLSMYPETWREMTEDEQLPLVREVANTTLPAQEAIPFVLEWMDLPDLT